MAAGAAGWLDDKPGIDVSRVYPVATDRLAVAKAEQEPGAPPAAAGSAAGRVR